jgi:CrcB protein
MGTAGREGLTLAVPAIGRFPSTVFAINIVGALLLGMLLEALVRRGADQGGRRAIRLLVGTGVMGGFTTYSTLATDTASLLAHGAAALAVTYALATVLVGACATGLGIAGGAALHRRREAGGA